MYLCRDEDNLVVSYQDRPRVDGLAIIKMGDERYRLFESGPIKVRF